MRRIHGALAGVFLASAVNAADFRTVEEHMRFLGAGPEIMALAPQFSQRIRIYDPAVKADVMQRVFTALLPRDSLADTTRTPDMEADEICKVYSTTRPETALAALEKFLQFEIENRERISGYELAFWFLFHELEHCGQNGAAHLRLNPVRVMLETEADFNAIKKIREANPESNIAEVIVAFRSIRSSYANAFLLEKRLRGEHVPDAQAALRTHLDFTRQIFGLVPFMMDAGPAFLREPDKEMARGVVALSLMKDPRIIADEHARLWAEQHLKGFRFFAPRQTAEYESVAKKIIDDRSAQLIARLRPH